MAPTNPPPGLSTAEELIEAADYLTAFAESADDWIQEEFQAKDITQAQAFEGFEANGRVRSQANMLYIDAVKSIVSNLQESQASIRSTIKGAEKALEYIDKFKQFIDMVADMLVLAAAIYAGKPLPILAALKEIRNNTDEAKKKDAKKDA